MHSEGLRKFHSSPSFIGAIGTMRMSWAEHLTPCADLRDACKILVGKL
jgi:hypothetical protein